MQSSSDHSTIMISVHLTSHTPLHTHTHTQISTQDELDKIRNAIRLRDKSGLMRSINSNKVSSLCYHRLMAPGTRINNEKK